MRRQLFGHDVEEAREHGWDALSNGELLERAEEAGYEVLITTDQDIQHQQNMSNRRVAVVVLMNTAGLASRGERRLSATPLRGYSPAKCGKFTSL